MGTEMDVTDDVDFRHARDSVANLEAFSLNDLDMLSPEETSVGQVWDRRHRRLRESIVGSQTIENLQSLSYITELREQDSSFHEDYLQEESSNEPTIQASNNDTTSESVIIISDVSSTE